MSKPSAKQKPGKALQDLVAIIESLLGDDAEIKSPDYLIDKTTGKKREVDVSIRRRVASQPVLIIEECRDHKRPVKVDYVEQVVQKREDVGADRAVIVSRVGFSDGARAKAEAHSIGLMTLEQAMDANWPEWLGTSVFTLRYPHFEIERLQIEVPKADDKTLPQRRDIGDDTELQRQDGSVWGTIGDLKKSLRVSDDLSVPANQPPIPLNCDIELVEPLFIRTEELVRPLTRLVAHGKYSVVAEEVPIEALQYSSSDSVVAQVAQATFPVGLTDQTAKAYLMRAEDGTIKLAMEFSDG
jgi:hypothetical protein